MKQGVITYKNNEWNEKLEMQIRRRNTLWPNSEKNIGKYLTWSRIIALKWKNILVPDLQRFCDFSDLQFLKMGQFVKYVPSLEIQNKN